MPCDTMAKTAAERRAREEALAELERQIEAGEVNVRRNLLTGQVSLSGWKETAAAKSGWCEGCAMAALAQKGSPVVRTNLAGAGVSQGKSFVAASHAGHPHKVGGGHGHGH